MATKKNSSDKAAAQARRAARKARNERAKALAEERRRAQKRKQRLTRVGIVVGVLLAIGAGFVVVRSLGSDKPATPPAGASDSYGLRVGDKDAPTSVVIYEDFLCPFCGQLEQTAGDRLDAAVKAGEMSVEYRPVSFLGRIDDYSPESANAFGVVLDAAGADVAKAFHDLLFDNQPSESGPFPDADDLVALAVEAGAVESEVRPGIEDLTFEGWVDAAGDAASEADIDSTPSVLIDGEKVEFTSVDELVTTIFGPTG